MILDTIANAQQYESLNAGFKLAFDFCRSFNCKDYSCGRYELDGDSVFAMVSEYDSVPVESMDWEGHRDYIDVQFLAQGKECIGWMPLRDASVKSEYDAANDFQTFLDAPGTFLRMAKSDFAVFFPEDIHKPKCICDGSSHNIKIVVKIHI